MKATSRRVQKNEKKNIQRQKHKKAKLNDMRLTLYVEKKTQPLNLFFIAFFSNAVLNLNWFCTQQ